MQVHDEYIEDEMFSAFVRHMPQCCVEIVVQTDEGVLLAKRTNKPVEGEWFWPGSRLLKGEPVEDAAHRIADEELGLDIEILEELGVTEHRWETSAEAGEPSRHTVNVIFLVEPATPSYTIDLDDQHTATKFVTMVDDTYHQYVQHYMTTFDLPR